MTSYIPEALRREVTQRAKQCCEYCLTPLSLVIKQHEIDHIFSEKHGGLTESDNLCLSCFDCNRYKGSDICSVDLVTRSVVGLYHPRQQSWKEHFRLTDAVIEGITPTGRVTVRLLRLNEPERVDERREWINLDLYP